MRILRQREIRFDLLVGKVQQALEQFRRCVWKILLCHREKLLVMSVFELRYMVESSIPWWVPFAVIGGLLISYAKWRRDGGR